MDEVCVAGDEAPCSAFRLGELFSVEFSQRFLNGVGVRSELQCEFSNAGKFGTGFPLSSDNTSAELFGELDPQRSRIAEVHCSFFISFSFTVRRRE